jgi:pimeloyl-ACP methyl ester carboxylesterase
MNYTKTYFELKAIFNLVENKIKIDEEMEIVNLPFNSECYLPRIMDELKQAKDEPLGLGMPDSHFFENNHFTYPVFVPGHQRKYSKAIILLHGLNERQWDKYLPWAYFLAKQTQQPVILFPIAFHMNRGPVAWNNAKSLAPMIAQRKNKFETQSLTFANIALSSRLTDDPLRFLKSGYQTADDIILLKKQLEQGLIPLFEQGTQTNIFAYSIGAFVAQIMLLAYPESFAPTSRLFLFCGGAFFNEMNGVSKLIMDQTAFESIREYYVKSIEQEVFTNKLLNSMLTEFPLGKAFYAMLKEENNKPWREETLNLLAKQVYAIILQKDKVIPALGTEKVMKCSKNATENYEIIDFPYDYSHETPFPVSGKAPIELVDTCFNEVFTKAAKFLN